MWPEDLLEAASAVLKRYEAKQKTLATAESCTGGLIAALLTEIEGSSAVVDRGFITYSNAAKTAMLGVDAIVIERYGAVSEQTAHRMAQGALTHSDADVAVAVTGVAGPTGGSALKPVGTVCFGLARKGTETIAQTEWFKHKDRFAVRIAAVHHALALLEAGL